MTPLQTATMIKVYLDQIVRHAQRAEYEVSTVHGRVIPMPEGRAHQDLQHSLKELFEACDVLRLKLQDERSDLAPPTREEKIAAVMSAMQFLERTTSHGDISLVGSLAMQCSACFRPDPGVVAQKDRMKHRLAEIVSDGLSASELQRMVKWHRERMTPLAMDIQSEERNP